MYFPGWISQWQVVVGLVIYLSSFWFCFCIFVPMQSCIGRLYYGSRHHFEQHHLRRERNGILLLLECAGKFLIIYGTLKYSPALAVLVIMVQSLLTSLYDVLLGLSDPLKEIKEGEEQYLQDTQNDAPNRRRWRSVHDVQGNEKSNVLEPVSAYSDFEGCGLLECTLVFVVQMMLYAVLIASVFTRKPEEATDHEVMKVVGGAVIAALMAARGESFHKN